MKEEMIDIYDEFGNRIGVEKRSLVKKLGHWHNTFQCWVFLEEGEENHILFQKRHKNKKWNGGKLATSAGGHLTAGESIEDGIRELNEELGVYPDPKELIFLGVYQEIRKNERENNKENQHVFLYVTDRKLEDFSFQLEEVAGIYKMYLDDFSALVNQKKDSVKITGIEWEEGAFQRKIMEAHLNEIVGSDGAYLEFSLEKILKALKNIK